MPEPDEPSLTIPVIEEVATINKVALTTDVVRVHTTTETRDVLVEDVVERGALRVERVAVERQVDVAPPVRKDGDTTVIPIVEERLVVEKRLFVVEEIHVTQERSLERVAIPVTLRATRATIERPSHTSSNTSTGSNTNG